MSDEIKDPGWKTVQPLFDRPNVKTRTWPFGTQKQVLVKEVIAKPTVHGVICIESETNEAFVLIQKEDPDAKAGDRIVIIFTEGGPTGGYWRIENHD